MMFDVQEDTETKTETETETETTIYLLPHCSRG